MKRPTLMLGLLAVVLALGLCLPARPAVAQDTGVIHGTVYVDMNANLVRDPGEPAYVGAEIIVANGQTGWSLLTAGDGAFRVDVPTGTWQVALMVPEGFAPANDATREVTISPEATLDANMEFALLSMTVAPAPDGQAPTPTATAPPVLPQTGAPLAPTAAIALGLAGLLAAGLLLAGFGRWAARR